MLSLHAMQSGPQLRCACMQACTTCTCACTCAASRAPSVRRVMTHVRYFLARPFQWCRFVRTIDLAVRYETITIVNSIVSVRLLSARVQAVAASVAVLVAAKLGFWVRV